MDEEVPMKGELQRLHITGVMVSYYHICHTKLWLFAHNITMEHESESVAMGHMIHEYGYKRERKEVDLPGMKIDFIRSGDNLVIHEVKKSSRMEKADRYQVLYYLYELRRMGVEAKGVINYPKSKKVVEVELSPDDVVEMEGILADIETIVKGPYIEPVRKGICRKCAYFMFCFGG